MDISDIWGRERGAGVEAWLGVPGPGGSDPDPGHLCRGQSERERGSLPRRLPPVLMSPGCCPPGCLECPFTSSSASSSTSSLTSQGVHVQLAFVKVDVTS
ncbi:unnamed protein product [Arctogadus glacialis]